MTTPPDHADDRPTVRASVPPAREWVRVYVIGLFMGTADGIPGVSGGTIALIAGIYQRLIAAVTAVTPRRFVAGVRALLPTEGGVAVGDALDVWETVDGWFLAALLAGIVTAVVAVTGVIAWASTRYPIPLYGVFFGLIAASAVILLREISIRAADEVAAAVAGFAIAFVVSGASSVVDGGGLAVIFVAGVFAISAMILPGISGSLVLVMVGLHAHMSRTLHGFIDAVPVVLGGGSVNDLVRYGAEIVAFVGGGLIGLFTIARLVRRALDADRTATLAFLVALVVGALRAPIVQLQVEYGVTWTTGDVTQFAVAATVGAVLVLVLDWYAVDLDLEAA